MEKECNLNDVSINNNEQKMKVNKLGTLLRRHLALVT